MNESGSFMDWKVGQRPNTALLFVGYCCCIGIPLICQLHAFRTQLKATFDEIDDGMHWVCVIIGIFGLYQNDKQLGELERKYNVQAQASSLPWWVTIVVPILWPMALASQMNRLNAIAEAVKK